MNIYLVRHGKQNSDLCNVNVPLHEIGIKQAQLLGNRLASYDIDGLYSSDLIRAVETANILKTKIMDQNPDIILKHEVREGFREIDFGNLEGKTEEAYKIEFADFFNERDRFEDDLPYPGGEGGLQVFQRAYPVLEEITRSGLKNVVVVAHGGTIRSLVAGILGMEHSKMLLFAIGLQNCSITQLYYNEEKKRFYLQRFNDFAHLEQDTALIGKK